MKRTIGLLGVLTLLLFTYGMFLLAGSDTQKWSSISQILGDFGTFLISVLGAIAGLWWFSTRQILVPHLNIHQEVIVLPGPDSCHLIQVIVRLENVGQIPVSIKEWRIQMWNLTPIGEDLKKLLAANFCLDKELKWPRNVCREIDYNDFGELRIRAGEHQERVASVIVKKGQQAIRIYSFFPHSGLNLKKGENRGWTRHSVVVLGTTKEGS